MSRMSTVLPSLLTGAVAGGLVAVAVAGTGGSSSKTVTTVISSRTAAVSVPTALSHSQGMTINQIYRHDSPGVVDITVVSRASAGTNVFGGSSTQESEDEGAGVVYDKQGDILTDEHVVANAVSVEVHFQNGLSVPAKVLGSDASTDVGVIKVNVPASELHPIAFANSAAAQVGDPVVAIGSPFSLPETTTAGIVSAIGRDIKAPNGYTITGAIQTDAAINPGNSGGPLLDADGQVLGLNDQIQTDSGSSSGVGFATPGNTDVRVTSAIIAGHPIQHAYVGVCLQDTNGTGAQIEPTASQECTSPIASGSPAAKAGLKPGDTITAINSTAITSTQRLHQHDLRLHARPDRDVHGQAGLQDATREGHAGPAAGKCAGGVSRSLQVAVAASRRLSTARGGGLRSSPPPPRSGIGRGSQDAAVRRAGDGALHQLAVNRPRLATAAMPAPVRIERPRVGVVGEAALEGVLEFLLQLRTLNGRQSIQRAYRGCGASGRRSRCSIGTRRRDGTRRCGSAPGSVRRRRRR